MIKMLPNTLALVVSSLAFSALTGCNSQSEDNPAPNPASSSHHSKSPSQKQPDGSGGENQKPNTPLNHNEKPPEPEDVHAFHQMNPNEAIKAWKAGTPLASFDQATINTLVARPGFPVGSLSRNQVVGLGVHPHLTKLVMLPEFPLKDLTGKQIQSLSGEVLTQLIRKNHFKTEKLSTDQVLFLRDQGLFEEVLGRGIQLQENLIQALDTKDLLLALEASQGHIPINQLSRAQIQNIPAKTPSGMDWLATLIHHAIATGYIEWVHEVTPYFTQAQIQKMSFSQYQILVHTNFPMALLSKEQKKYLNFLTGAYGEEFLEDFLASTSLFKQAIQNLNSDKVAELLKRDLRGFPIGFLSKEQVQSLSDEQIHSFVERLAYARDSHQTLMSMPLTASENAKKLLYQRLFLYSRGILPFSYLNSEQSKILTEDEKRQIKEIKEDLQLDQLVSEPYVFEWGGFEGINICQYFKDIAGLPLVSME
jgi:hypothetical protein